jgi:septal ring factor EnvC (AmiA/AmiB activator)
MTPTLQASDLDVEGLVALGLAWLRGQVGSVEPERLVAAANAIEAALQSLSAQLAAAERERDAARANAITFQQAAATILKGKQAAEANLAAANKQIEEMRGALERRAEPLSSCGTWSSDGLSSAGLSISPAMTGLPRRN